MQTDWIVRLVLETFLTSETVTAIVNAVLNAEDAGEATIDSYEYAGFNGEVKGLIKALKLQGARSETIVEAIEQVRREREA